MLGSGWPFAGSGAPSAFLTCYAAIESPEGSCDPWKVRSESTQAKRLTKEPECLQLESSFFWRATKSLRLVAEHPPPVRVGWRAVDLAGLHAPCAACLRENSEEEAARVGTGNGVSASWESLVDNTRHRPRAADPEERGDLPSFLLERVPRPAPGAGHRSSPGGLDAQAPTVPRTDDGDMGIQPTAAVQTSPSCPLPRARIFFGCENSC